MAICLVSEFKILHEFQYVFSVPLGYASVSQFLEVRVALHHEL